MGIKQYKATTPSRRGMTVLSNDEITKSTPEKSLVTVLKKNAGRNSYGKITAIPTPTINIDKANAHRVFGKCFFVNIPE